MAFLNLAVSRRTSLIACSAMFASLIGCSQIRKKESGFVPIVEGAMPCGTVTADRGGVIDTDYMYQSQRSYDELSSEMTRAGWHLTTRLAGREFISPQPVPGYAQVEVVIQDMHRSRIINVRWRRIALDENEKVFQAEALAHPNVVPKLEIAYQHEIDALIVLMRKVDSVAAKLKTKRKLTGEDKQLLVDAVQTNAVPAVTQADQIFARLVDQGQYDQKDLLTLIERQSVLVNAPTVLAHDYGSQLGIGPPTDKHLIDESDRILATHTDRMTLSSEEKTFVSKALSDNSEVNQVLACDILFPKHDLDSSLARWMANIVADQVHRTKGNVRRFWEYVQRVTAVKNDGLIHLNLSSSTFPNPAPDPSWLATD